MNWSARLRLLTGLIAVLGVVAIATDHLNTSRGHAESTTAEIAAEDYQAGAPYAGLLVAQPVTVGDEVRAGDPVAVIDSSALRRDLADEYVQPRVESGDVDAQGNLVVRATADGVVAGLAVTEGTFVQAGAPLVTVRRSGSTHVLAEYDLSTSQYGRLQDGADVVVRLADGRDVEGVVGDVSVVTTDTGETRVRLAVTSSELDDLAREDRLITPGAPVTAVVSLENDGLVTDVSAAVRTYLSQTFEGGPRAAESP